MAGNISADVTKTRLDPTGVGSSASPAGSLPPTIGHCLVYRRFVFYRTRDAIFAFISSRFRGLSVFYVVDFFFYSLIEILSSRFLHTSEKKKNETNTVCNRYFLCFQRKSLGVGKWTQPVLQKSLEKQNGVCYFP